MYNMTDQTVNADFAFEVSWEVCNKVGGIHTVLESLASTFQRLSKAGRNVNRPITLNRVLVSVPERIEQLSQEIKAKHTYSFWELIGLNYNRSYVVVTFLALLQMVKEGKLHIDQVADSADLQIYV